MVGRCRSAGEANLRTGEAVELRFVAPPPPAAGLERTVTLRIDGYYEISVGDRGWLNPLAVLAHRSGRDSLPRHVLRLAQRQASR